MRLSSPLTKWGRGGSPKARRRGGVVDVFDASDFLPAAFPLSVSVLRTSPPLPRFGGEERPYATIPFCSKFRLATDGARATSGA